jgi:hypothetical protein
MKPFAQSDFVSNSHEVLSISVPIELNPQRFQGLVPGPMMHRLGIGQNSVEIEEKGVEARDRRRGDQAIIIS